jgi:hypothetical protein
METIKDDCKMAAAEKLHDILAEADNAVNLASQPTPPTAEAEVATADE